MQLTTSTQLTAVANATATTALGELAMVLTLGVVTVPLVVLALRPGWAKERTPDTLRTNAELAALRSSHLASSPKAFTPPGLPTSPDQVWRRSLQLTVGLLLFSASMALVVRAGLGAMPWDVLTLGLRNLTGWSFGTITFLTSALVLALWIPLRQRPGVGTVANVVVISAAMDPILHALEQLPDPNLAGQVLYLIGGIVLNAVATALYIGAGLGPGPRDGLMTGLVRQRRWPLRWVKIAIEVTVAAAGAVLGGTVGIGTVIFAIGVGPLIHPLVPLVRIDGRSADLRKLFERKLNRRKSARDLASQRS